MTSESRKIDRILELVPERVEGSLVNYNGVDIYKIILKKSRNGKWKPELESVLSETELDDLIRDLPLEVKADLRHKAYPIFVGLKLEGLNPSIYMIEMTDHAEFVEYAADNGLKNIKDLRKHNMAVYRFAEAEGSLSYMFPHLHSAEELIGEDRFNSDLILDEMATYHEYPSEEDDEIDMEVDDR